MFAISACLSNKEQEGNGPIDFQAIGPWKPMQVMINDLNHLRSNTTIVHTFFLILLTNKINFPNFTVASEAANGLRDYMWNCLTSITCTYVTMLFWSLSNTILRILNFDGTEVDTSSSNHLVMSHWLPRASLGSKNSCNCLCKSRSSLEVR